MIASHKNECNKLALAGWLALEEGLTDVVKATEEFFECYIMSNIYKERHAGEKAAMMKGPINDESKPVETEPIT